MTIENVTLLTSSCSTRATLLGYTEDFRAVNGNGPDGFERRMTFHVIRLFGQRNGRDCASSEPYPEVVVIANTAARAGGVERNAENVLTGREPHVPSVEVRPVLPSAGVGNG